MNALVAVADPNSSFDESLAALCKAAADQLRLQVLRVLSREAYSVQELCHILDVRQSALSHHLKQLTTVGLTTTRREGNTIFYRRAWRAQHHALELLQAQLLSAADEMVLDAQILARLSEITQRRAQQSREFFEAHQNDFASQQEQMAAFSVYGPATEDMLDEHGLSGELAVEVGPGEGRFLGPLAQRFTKVLALDNSAAMLSLARVASTELENVSFVEGDLRSSGLAESLQGQQADCVVMNMVLHHVALPAEMMSDAASLLKTGGVLSITDLCSHDLNSARESCGDLWLGFEPDDLSQWALSAGLEEGPSAYLAQKNGFRVQIRHFLKA